jgi:hypothetical protein
MGGKTTSAGRQHTGGHPRLAASQAPLGHVASFAAQWPLRSFLELGALPGAVPYARLHARQVLWEWGYQRGFHLMKLWNGFDAAC